MSRARKAGDSVSDGMRFIALAPFPAFNPLNWWALGAPANAMRASLHVTRATLEAWRAGADGLRVMVRAQQDALLALTEDASAKSEAPEADEAQSVENEAAPASAGVAFVAPMLEVTRAYGQMGKAFIVAQRDTMRAFTEAGKPH